MDGEVTELRMIAWEVTRNCNLSCLHCRAAACRGPYENELSTEECFSLLDEIAGFSSPVVILTGGEPLLRDDILELARHGTGKGLRMVMAVNGTLLDEHRAAGLREAGVKRLSISIDGATEESHDGLRQVKGAFRGAVEGVRAAQKAGLEYQLNTTVTKRNVGELPEILELGRRLNAAAHHVFFLVPTGRGKEMVGEELSAAEYEKTLAMLSRLDDRERIRVTCAPHYYRIINQAGVEEGRETRAGGHLGKGKQAQPGGHPGKGRKARPGGHPGSTGRRGCLAGNAFCFISHVGDVQPCGYLELRCGNVRESGLEDIWKNSPVFRHLRQPELLKGKCGLCEFKEVCGGCRARADAAVGDYLGEEPCCLYVPRCSREAVKGSGA